MFDKWTMTYYFQFRKLFQSYYYIVIMCGFILLLLGLRIILGFLILGIVLLQKYFIIIIF
jgi:hypothetical protein